MSGIEIASGELMGDEKPESRQVPCEAPCYADPVEALREMVKVQCADENWNYSEYMHGMANGMILALSLFDDKHPAYLDRPEKWLCDLPCTEEVKSVCVEA